MTIKTRIGRIAKNFSQLIKWKIQIEDINKSITNKLDEKIISELILELQMDKDELNTFNSTGRLGREIKKAAENTHTALKLALARFRLDGTEQQQGSTDYQLVPIEEELNSNKLTLVSCDSNNETEQNLDGTIREITPTLRQFVCEPCNSIYATFSSYDLIKRIWRTMQTD